MYEKNGYLKMCVKIILLMLGNAAGSCYWQNQNFSIIAMHFFCLIASWGWLNTAVHACTFMPSSKYCSVALRFFDKIHGT